MAKTLEQWSATLQRVPQMVDGLNDIIKDSKLKLPDRKWHFMYQSPEMQNFREMGAMEEVAKKQQEHRILREEVLETARETGGNVPDISHVAAAVTHQANMTEALRQQMEGLNASTRREQEGMRQEAARELERLAVAQRAEANRSRIAEEVALRHRDAMAADRDRMAEAVQAAGVVNNNVTHLYDQRVTNNTV
jgi:vacuolar-type H+-ATPase subunit I/STV1